MRVVIFVNRSSPLFTGGTEVATTKIAEQATRMGHSILVLNPDPANLMQIAKQVAGFKPDIIHAQGSKMGIFALAVSRLTGIPFILYGRGEIYVRWRFKHPITRILMACADRVIAQTEHMKRELLKCYNRDIEVIPNGIDTEMFGKLSRVDARTKLGLPQDGKIVLTVSRFRPEKNMMCFVNAALWSRRQDVLYLSIGDGEQFEQVSRYVDKQSNQLQRGNIRLLGAKPNEQIPDYMSAADVFVNTSLSEGFPMSILEAMTSGLPIVAPEVCGIPEIVKDGAGGLLTPPDNPMATAKAIDIVLNASPEWLRQVAEHNRREAEKYTWENVAKKLYG